MKFSRSIQFNAVPDWAQYYISYSNLKKLIYSLEWQVNHGEEGGTHVESSPLLSSAATVDTDAVLQRALNIELEKICDFYTTKEQELFVEVIDVQREFDAFMTETEGMNFESVENSLMKTKSIDSQRRHSVLQHLSQREWMPHEDHAISDDDSDAEEHDRLRRSWLGRDHISEGGGSSIDPSRSGLYHRRSVLEKRIINAYVSLCELRSYVQLNRTGFSKALKKYDKILDRALRRAYLASTVYIAYPFSEDARTSLDEQVTEVERMYAELVTKGDLSLAKRELRLNLREQVVWERNTVWREMIGIERKAQAAGMGTRRTLLAGDTSAEDARRQGEEEVAAKEFVTPIGRCPVPGWMLTSSFATLVAIVVVFGAVLGLPIMQEPEQQNCLAVLVFVSLLWATEVIPLFVTSIMVPFLVVTLRVLRAEDGSDRRLPAPEASKVAFASMWTSVIMLLLGGFAIAAALSKYDIARRMATFVLSKAGTKPQVVLLTNMFVSMVLSMWISNVAAPVLCYSIIQPLLRNLPVESHFAKALILGIALSSNIGGAASPIASPQNIIALQNMDDPPSWGTWFFIAIPVCVLTIVLIWVLLISTFKVTRNTTIVPIRPVKEQFTGVQWFISLVTLATIVLWCVSHQLQSSLGDMGVIAIIPLVLFFGSGILTKEDFNNFLWTIIILAAGGLCLGHAVTSSGLLQTIATSITTHVAHLSLYAVLLVFALLILVVATFISHTVAALIMLPLVHEVGASMNGGHPSLLVMGSALMCSVAMGLPTSGFPNMTAVMMEAPETGQRYLRVRHFLTRGLLASGMAFGVVVTVGYGLMMIAGL